MTVSLNELPKVENTKNPDLAVLASQFSPVGLIITDRNFGIQYANPAANLLLGSSPINPGDSLLMSAKNQLEEIANVLSGQDNKNPTSLSVEIPSITNNKARTLRWNINTIPEHQNQLMISITDVSDAERYKSLSYQDPLTKLPNQRYLELVVNEADEQKDSYGVVGYMDISGLHDVNTKKGHTAGDRLIQNTAQALQSCIRQGEDTLTKGSEGDEFAAIYFGVNPEFIKTLEARYREKFAEYNQLHRTNLKVRYIFAAFNPTKKLSTALTEVKDTVKQLGRNTGT